SAVTNPYQPPGAPVETPDVAATTRLVTLYRTLVITSLLVGWISFFGFLGFLETVEMAGTRQFAGVGSILPPEALYYSYLGLQPVWLVTAVGLCLLRWWGRILFVATYVANGVLILTGGVEVWMPWDQLIVTVTTLIDGAIMVLSFVP